MKRIASFVLLLATLVSAKAQEQAINLGLIPTPQEVRLLDGSSHEKQVCSLHKAKIVEQQVDTLPVAANLEQAYQLICKAKKIHLKYVGEAGRQNAYLTLEQLKQLHEWIPCVAITDWPAYSLRGWMDDISRGPVTHEAYRNKQWETLHALKYNFCNYYTEHTLYQREFPDLAPAYADTRRLPDEVINLQLFAHAEKTLRVPFYEHLMDGKANFNPDNEATYDFLRRRIAEAFRQMPQSPFFIIDCDETEQLGTGRAKKLVDSKGADQVYVDYINRCYGLVRENGSTRVVMWGDIVAKNPAMMRQLPRDMTYIMWAYEPLDSYDHLIRPFKDNGTPFWVAPSLSHSSNMIPNPYRYMKNIANLARDGYHAGAEGIMNTCWDDNGEALFDNCWHGLFWSAEMSWNPIRTDDPEEFRQREARFNENFERLFYGTAEGKQTNTLYETGNLESDPTVADWYTSASLLEPLLNFNPDNTSPAMNERAEHVRHLLDNIHVDSAANPHAHYALHRIALTAQKCRLRTSINNALSDTMMLEDCKYRADDYLKGLFDLKREYLRLWDQENGDYERHIVLNRYDALAREVLDLDRHVFMSVGYDAASSSPKVTLRTLYGNRPIYYTLDGSEPNASSHLYTDPFPLEQSATIKAICYNEYGEGVITEQYLLSHKAMGAKIKLNTRPSTYKAIYSGGGDNALIDGLQGSNATYADGHWQGYWGDSIDAVIEFATPQDIHSIDMRFMQNTFDWILAPASIEVYASADGEHWQTVGLQSYQFSPNETGMRLRNCHVDCVANTRWLRIVVPNRNHLPQWHPASDQPAYLFADEIIIR